MCNSVHEGCVRSLDGGGGGGGLCREGSIMQRKLSRHYYYTNCCFCLCERWYVIFFNLLDLHFISFFKVLVCVYIIIISETS